MKKTHKNIKSLLEEATGNPDVVSMDFKDIEHTTKDKIDFKRVRGSVRLMSGKIKTAADVKAMKKAFLDLKIP